MFVFKQSGQISVYAFYNFLFFFVGYLTKLSATPNTYCLVTGFIMNDELQRTGNKAVVIKSRNYPFIYLEGLNNTMQQISNGSRIRNTQLPNTISKNCQCTKLLGSLLTE
jgi:hypothetical protein